MRDLCNRIVLACGDFWGWSGWMLFGLSVLGPLLLSRPEAGMGTLVFLLLITPLLLLWWLIDVLDQEVPLWIVLTGVVILGIGCLPMGGILRLAAFVFYMTRVRE